MGESGEWLKIFFYKINMTRNFVSPDVEGGRFTGKVPSVVAKKVARKLLQDQTTIAFSIREVTQGSAKKTYNYVGTKKTLNPPKLVKRGDVEFKVTTEYIVKKA
jgi:hypothetical protein